MTFSRETFETLIVEIVDATIMECKKTLEDANLDPAALDEIILVGGSSRIPFIQEKLQEVFPCPLNRSVNPDEVIALGAAIQADMLSGDASQSIILLDVTPFSLGIEEKGGHFKALIHRNSSIPIEVKKKATTVVDNQRTIKIHVLQGESDLAIENHSLGEFELTDIAPANRGVPKIDIRISLDSNGLVKVSATDTRSGRKEQILIERSNTLSGDDIEKSRHKVFDNSATPTKDIKQEIRQKLDTLLQFVEKHKDAIEPSYKKQIKELQYRGAVIVQKTDQISVLDKLLKSIDSIHSDLLDRIRPKLSDE
jgi:molecular chaperone DnaK